MGKVSDPNGLEQGLRGHWALERCGGQMGELAGDEVSDGDQMPGGAVATHSALGKPLPGAAHRLPTLSGLAPTTPQSQQQNFQCIQDRGSAGWGKPLTHRKRNRGRKSPARVRSP